MITRILLLAFMAFITETEANHPGSGAHHHQQEQQHHHDNHQTVQTPFVSSFSHSLPGTNSYMSVTRYFNAPAAVHTSPSLNHSDGGADTDDDPKAYYDPWNPRFQVPRIEASDDEWEEQLREVFEESGLLGTQLLKQVPKGLVNLNYDIHICVHMGTELTPEESAYPPTAVSYPGEGKSADKFHTLLLLDAELNKLHWMVVNILGAKVHEGKVITAYAGPNPARDTGPHRYIVLVMEQSGLINDELTEYKSESSCQTQNLGSFDLTSFQEKLNLSQPVAANYFTQKFNPFVESINGHCLRDVPIQPHPLYK